MIFNSIQALIIVTMNISIFFIRIYNRHHHKPIYWYSNLKMHKNQDKTNNIHSA